MALQGSDFVLASQSPRRRVLLEQIGLTGFSVCPADVDEQIPDGILPEELVRRLSRRKALAVSAPGKIVIAADTIVALEDQILGKPKNPEDARAMLARLSGRTHRVFTGVTVRRDEQVLTGAEMTQVTFRRLSPREIDAYVATGDPLDKAGSYGIQGRGCLLVQGIQGDFFNVMGLPLNLLADLLEPINISLRTVEIH